MKDSKINDRFNGILGGLALNEKFIQFFARIYVDIPDCKMAAFVTPKYICGSNMQNFREFWKAKYLDGFATPARTHDNCTGQYPICLFIWDLAVKEDFPKTIPCDIYNKYENNEGVKYFCSYEGKRINDWLRNYYDKNNGIGFFRIAAAGFDLNDKIYIASKPAETDVKKKMVQTITEKNLIISCIYFAIRHCIEHTWLNHHAQFLYPNEKYENDYEFQNDCLMFTLFNGKNKVKICDGINHWIPFTEDEVSCAHQFESHFMSGYIKNKLFSSEAQTVLNSGKKLWSYYHSKAETDKSVNINSSFYDIRDYFQGRTGSGNMKTKSADETYNALIKALRQNLSVLAEKIKPKVYEYGFLLE